MITFNGAKYIGSGYYLCFSNENGSVVDIPVKKEMFIWFMRYMDRLSPPKNEVEGPVEVGSK